MIGSLITRGLVLMFGYAYPAYECYKTVELNKPDVQQLRFWCQYWILVAMLTVCERIGDLFIGWLPMYGEAKLAFFIYLWFPKTKGTVYVYDSFFRPYVAKHETDIDRNLVELRTRAGDMAVMYFQKAASYSQTRVFEILQYIASQSNTARPAQAQGQGTTKVQKPTASPARASAPPARTSSAPSQSQDGQLSSPASSTASSSEEDASEEAGPSEISKAVSAPAETLAALIGKSKSSDSADTQAMQQGKSESSSASQNAQPLSEDTVMEESRRVTRARSKRPVQRQLSK